MLKRLKDQACRIDTVPLSRVDSKFFETNLRDVLDRVRCHAGSLIIIKKVNDVNLSTLDLRLDPDAIIMDQLTRDFELLARV